MIACNTATALALDQIRQRASVRVLGVIEPGAQRALAATKSRKVVVIGTEATVCSHAYQHALSALQLEAREKACPLLVSLVEEGWVDHQVTEQVARIYLNEAFSEGFKGADVLLLGCTHYPLLKPVLHRVVPQGVSLVDSAESTALAVWNLLNVGSENVQELRTGVAAAQNSEFPAHVKFFVTDSTEKFRRLGRLFLGKEIEQIAHVDLKE